MPLGMNMTTRISKRPIDDKVKSLKGGAHPDPEEFLAGGSAKKTRWPDRLTVPSPPTMEVRARLTEIFRENSEWGSEEKDILGEKTSAQGRQRSADDQTGHLGPAGIYTQGFGSGLVVVPQGH